MSKTPKLDLPKTPLQRALPLTQEERRPAAVREAIMRLRAYVERYPEYGDRDRDIILLHLLDMAKQK